MFVWWNNRSLILIFLVCESMTQVTFHTVKNNQLFLECDVIHFVSVFQNENKNVPDVLIAVLRCFKDSMQYESQMSHAAMLHDDVSCCLFLWLLYLNQRNKQ